MEAGHSDEAIAFRRFHILPRQRRLLADGEPVALRPRAFDLLLALVEAAGSMVSHDELIDRVWQDRTVTENNLQVQIAALRNALGDDRDLIRTVARRGYQFTGGVEAPRLAAAEPPAPDVEPPVPLRGAPQTNLPEAVSELIGRQAELEGILALASGHRLVTLIGAGGIGKTRLALEAARHLQPGFAAGAWIVEMSTICDPAQVPQAVAAAVGLSPSATASAEQVAATIGAREMLIILDTCEHVIDAAAAMAEALLRRCAGVRVMAASREPLGAYDEWIYRIGPLDVRSPDETDIADCEAVSLFVARARAINVDFLAEPLTMAAIAVICRKLDGIPLAIELAATRAATLGVHALASRLDDHLQLLTCGRRTALPRHQTLRATLDWSYRLLPAAESSVLRRLALCAGDFDLAEAHETAARAGLTPAQAIEALVNLVTKSLVFAKTVNGQTSYRLPEVTRAYALEKLASGGEPDASCRPHGEDQHKPRPFANLTPSCRDRGSSPTRLRIAA